MLQKYSLKTLDRVAYGVSVLVVLLVILMRMPKKINFGIDFSFLPPLYSTLNAIVAICLLLAYYFVKTNNIKRHKQLIIAALVLSFVFLAAYVLYHFTTAETKYCGVGNIRYFYFFLLITHVLLAGALLPFILMTFNRAIKHEISRHRRMARWVFPLWLYVAITGPIIYLMLKPCYQ